MTNFHDNVHTLVKSLKETSEYKEYLDIKNKILLDNELSNKVKEFKSKQKEHQMSYINNGKLDEEESKKLQDLYSDLVKNEMARKLFELEIRIDVLLADMQKIIAEGIKDIIEF